MLPYITAMNAEKLGLKIRGWIEIIYRAIVP